MTQDPSRERLGAQTLSGLCDYRSRSCYGPFVSILKTYIALTAATEFAQDSMVTEEGHLAIMFSFSTLSCKPSASSKARFSLFGLSIQSSL